MPRKKGSASGGQPFSFIFASWAASICLLSVRIGWPSAFGDGAHDTTTGATTVNVIIKSRDLRPH